MENDCKATATYSTQPFDTLSESSSTKQKTEVIRWNAKTVLWTCLIGLIALFVFVGIPLVQIIIGSLYKDKCPVNPYIPIYLIVTGAATLTVLPTLILGVTVKKLSFLLYLNMVFALLMFGWFITGTVWVIQSQNKVQFYNPNLRSTYCHNSVFSIARTLSFLNYFYLTNIVYQFAKS
ncbi:unnamed protein product [Rotaria sordida]|uniref:Uncharacterized protein n=1 Tax=Rotaria sordida TaxID=392033 RepID=A0A814M7Y0_9BILA|nr:unnamed protein product [Rotaria sordida]CAF1074527.1 unnamed protein product [Rotaria sordida]